MSTIAPPHPVVWTVPGPLWDAAAGGGEAFRRPALLRYASDRFMAEVTGELASTDPAAIAQRIATPVSYRVRPPGHEATWEPAGGPARPLKLFDSAHGHFNLVAASLVCQLPGLPERTVRTGDGDRVAFVLRRLAADGGEEAWLPGGRWVPAPAPSLVQGEEQLPLFALPYTDADGRTRQVHVGVIPTSSNESSPAVPAPATPAEAAKLAALRFRGEAQRLTDTYRTLRDQPVEVASIDHRDQQRAAVDVLLIDLADLLLRWHPDVHAAITGAGAPPAGPRSTLLTNLKAQGLAGGRKWSTALEEAWRRRDELLGETAAATQATLALSVHGASPAPAVLLQWLIDGAPEADAPAAPDAPASDPSGAPLGRAPKYSPSTDVRYVVRCAYLRPQCFPLDHDIVSPPSDPFAIAGFFDRDAPARPIHISLPIATGVKDLRALRKSVNVAMSDQLQRQMSRVGELKEIIQGNKATGQDIDVGLLCSFSIPIITLVALIILMIFVALLNIIFFWLPLLRICLPIPKVKP